MSKCENGGIRTRNGRFLCNKHIRVPRKRTAAPPYGRAPGPPFFRPAGRHVSKSLKKLFNELGTSPADRALAPLLADGSEVVWLWGCGFAEGLAPTAATRTVCVVRAWRDTEE